MKTMMTRSLLFASAALFAVACAGPAGPTGAQGPRGLTGVQGPQGPQGPQGSTGMTGSQGNTGMTGSQGLAGVTGAQGPVGSADVRSPGPGWASLRDFTFDYDRTDIRSSEQNQLSEIAAYVRQNPSVVLGVDGSTDLLRGTNQYNTGLSQRRIATVRDGLIRAGVSPDRIETGTFAAQRAGCNDSIERCAQRDGRVEVLVRSSN